MALTNSQYDSIMRMYHQKQFRNKREQDERIRKIYQKIPAIKEIDDSISTTAVSRARRMLSGDGNALDTLRAELEDLREQKQALILGFGYPEDYMEMHYQCEDCQDTGYVDSRKCHCFRRAEMELLYSQSNTQEILQKENFTTFSYDYYDREYTDPRIGKTPFEYMEQVVRRCRDFTEAFTKEKGNILFTGKTGTGKTFISNCIAKALIDQYFSVLYLSATDLFDIFSKNRFEYGNPEDLREMYQHILDCDMLVIDDLGTELINTFTSSQLFYCINERLNRKRGTIITTNLPLNQLQDNFTERVTSRILSHYQVIPLYGDDIRIQKKLKGID